MYEEFPIERLKAIKAIRPDPVFLKWSKRAIFADALPAIQAVSWRSAVTEFFARAVRPIATASAAFGIAAIALAAAYPSAAPHVAGLDEVNIAVERHAIAADAKTAEVRYFKGISPSISLALTDIIDPSTDYGSANHIKKGIALLTTDN